MTQIFSRTTTYIILLAILILVGWFFYLPTKITATLKSVLQEQTGRAVIIGNSSYRFSPRFGIALHNVTVAGTSELVDPVIHAKIVVVPLSIVQLLTGRALPKDLFVDGAEIRVSFDGVGHTNVFAGESPKAWPETHVRLSNSNFHYFDERSGDQFNFDQISGAADFLNDGEINTSGSAIVKGQFVNFNATLASLERAFSDGSPLDLDVAGAASSFTFSGRIATAQRLNLAGQADVTSTDAPRLMKWLGAEVAALADFKTLTLSGALDSDGPVMLLRSANMKLGEMAAKGEISFSNAGERPNITAALSFDRLKLLHLVAPENWSDQPIDFSVLDALDIKFRLAAASIEYGELKTGAATVEGELKDRLFNVVVKSQDMAGGAGQFDFGLDATQLPPKMKLDVLLNAVAAKPTLSALLNQGFLAGMLTLQAQLAATGNNPAELISTLNGNANFTLDGGTLSGVDLNALAAKPRHSWNGGQTLNLQGKAQFTIDEGVAKLGENQLDASGVSLHSEGDIDLLRKSLDVMIGPDVKVKIQGLWSAPSLMPQ